MKTKKYQFKKFLIFCPKSFTNWYFFVSILLRIICWFRIYTFFLGLLQYIGRYWSWKFGQNPENYVFWAIFAMYTIFFGTNRFVLVKATGPVLGHYGRVCAGRCYITTLFAWLFKKGCFKTYFPLKLYFVYNFGKLKTLYLGRH